MAYENGRGAENVPAGRQPIEDRALKMAAQFFGKELLPLLGIRERVKRIAPTEQIHLEIKDFMEDCNCSERGIFLPGQGRTRSIGDSGRMRRCAAFTMG